MTKPKVPKALDAIADVVLRYRPKPKSEPAVDPFTQNTGSRKKPNTKDWFAAMDQRYRNGR